MRIDVYTFFSFTPSPGLTFDRVLMCFLLLLILFSFLSLMPILSLSHSTRPGKETKKETSEQRNKVMGQE